MYGNAAHYPVFLSSFGGNEEKGAEVTPVPLKLIEN